MIDTQYVERFEQEGYVVVPSVLAQEEVETIKAHFMRLHARKIGFHDDGISDEHDPLFRYPRMIHPHRYDRLSRDWLLDPRLRAWTTALLGREPLAAQTMFYFKPPGARGQALHQDQRSLEVRPGTCLAAWMAVDPNDEDNGCMKIVPHTQDLAKLCLIDADRRKFFSGTTIELADWMELRSLPMQPGDVLFFNGQVIHGSWPNTTNDRFRRAMIAHYVVGEAQKVAKFYQPLLTFDGEEVESTSATRAGPCGVWVPATGSEAGREELELVERA